MDRYAIFVDAGYLLKQAVKIVSGGINLPRDRLMLSNPAGLIDLFKTEAEKALGNSCLLRTYWYDGVGNDMTSAQIAIATLPDVQFRAGSIHNKGQKGVDSRIVHDLFELASNHAISDAMVITGDGDLAVGVDFAQRRGMRVALLSVEDLDAGVVASRHKELLYLADRQVTIGAAQIRGLFELLPSATAAVPAQAEVIADGQSAPITHTAEATATAATEASKTSAEILAEVVEAVIKELPYTTAISSVSSSGGILSAVDKELLGRAGRALDRRLEIEERNEMREAFKLAVRRLEVKKPR